MPFCRICGEKSSEHDGEIVFGQLVCPRCAYQLRNLTSDNRHQQNTAQEYFNSRILDAKTNQRKESINRIITLTMNPDMEDSYPTTEEEYVNLPSDDGMFSNIGGKIKGLATLITWLGIFASIIIGIGFITSSFTLIGILIMIGGSLLSWISSFILFAFGKLVENTEILVALLSQKNR